ncbi:hypothetical protein AB4Z42_23395 [Mycobacterium sp. 2YAF39]|uniref:hypothetical protein n=1 Tax=Mycobacterium sp. 2YAF39 TaxID=3233033 RepID=UPI003F961097
MPDPQPDTLVTWGEGMRFTDKVHKIGDVESKVYIDGFNLMQYLKGHGTRRELQRRPDRREARGVPAVRLKCHSHIPPRQFKKGIAHA